MKAKKSMLELHRDSIEEFRNKEKFPIAVVLDNVRSLNNIGSILRTSDAFCASRVCLCGITATPPSAEIHKTALGAEDSVDWKYFPTTAEAIAELKRDGWTVCAVEQTADSISLEDFIPRPDEKYAVILGHEVYGVEQAVVDMADLVLEIPQFGTKHSLNVSVTAGIVIWHLAKATIQSRKTL